MLAGDCQGKLCGGSSGNRGICAGGSLCCWAGSTSAKYPFSQSSKALSFAGSAPVSSCRLHRSGLLARYSILGHHLDATCSGRDITLAGPGLCHCYMSWPSIRRLGSARIDQATSVKPEAMRI